MAGLVVSCGVLLLNPHGELLLGHSTGSARWDIPKGIADSGESALQAALRETAEETGICLEPAALRDLGRHTYLRGKDLHLFAALVERFDTARCVCTTSFRDMRGRLRPEMDAHAWVGFDAVAGRCGKAMVELLTRRLSLPLLQQQLRVAEAALGPVRWRWCAE
jgi:8-oxo-dGTP pyrophosphatase MutT (NUDIX family)